MKLDSSSQPADDLCGSLAAYMQSLGAL